MLKGIAVGHLSACVSTLHTTWASCVTVWDTAGYHRWSSYNELCLFSTEIATLVGCYRPTVIPLIQHIAGAIFQQEMPNSILPVIPKPSYQYKRCCLCLDLLVPGIWLGMFRIWSYIDWPITSSSSHYQ